MSNLGGTPAPFSHTTIDGRRIALTGVLGFVASHLLPRLAERRAIAIGIVRPGRDASRLERSGIEIRRLDLDRPDPATTCAAFSGIDALVHLSGIAQTTALLPAILKAGVARGVFVGSAGVYTRLKSPAADAKRAGEAALRASSLGYTILRPSMIYGTPADRNMVRLLRWLRSFPMVPMPGAGRTLQQPVHVEDLADAIVAALERPSASRQEYDVGGPAAIALRDVIRIAGRAVGRRPVLLPIPITPAHGMVVMMRRLKLPTPVRPEQVLRLTESKAVDIDPARRDLGFDPRSFEEGIAAEARMLLGAR
jgi:nucleoside-diphosphate-sugar epimerase